MREPNRPPVLLPLPPGLGDVVVPPQQPARVVAAVTEISRSLWAAAEVVSGANLVVPEFEGKLGLGYHLFLLTDVLRDLEHRLDELGAPGHRPRSVAADRPQLAALDEETDPARLFWLAYTCFLGSAVRDGHRLLAAEGALADGPTRHLLRQHLPMLDEALQWGLDAVERYLAVRDDRERHDFAEWVARCEEQPGGARVRRRVRDARRDERFSTFAHTRDYRSGGEPTATPYDADLLELVRINRDEIDAIETFCVVYFDLLEEAPLDMLHDLARTAWDECRHAMLGQRLLEYLGHDPFAYPCSMIGIMVRSALGGWDALAQISLFGELNIISPMRSLASRARRRGDEAVAGAFEFICADEAQHLKRIRSWLSTTHPLGDLEKITEHTQRLAGRELERVGVLNEEYFVSLTSAQIFELLGE